MPRVLLTAFGPYGEWSENASWLALQALMRDAPHGVDLTTRRYPVDFQGLRERMAADLVSRYDVAIHLGQAPGSGVVRLESVGINQAREVQEEGTEVRELEPGGPAAYRSTLPLDAWARMLCDEGIPAKVSSHAGDYLCNASLYWSHHFTAGLPEPPRAVMVHIPLDLSQAAKSEKELPSMPVEISAFAVRRLLESLASPSLGFGEGGPQAVSSGGVA